MKRPDFLDGMRGVAACIVLIGHCLNAFLPLWTGFSDPTFEALDPWIECVLYSPLGIFFHTSWAVVFFFVHSGFVLAYRYFSDGRSLAYLSSGALRRYFRLALPMLASVVFAYSLGKLVGYSSSEVSSWSHSVWLRPLFGFELNLSIAVRQALYGHFFSPYVAPSDSYNSSLWTIPIEYLATLGIFGFLALFGNLRQRWWLYAACAVILRSMPYLPFLFGVMLCDLYVSSSGFKGKFPRWAAWVFLAMGVYFGGWRTGAEGHGWYWVVPWLARRPETPLHLQTLSALCILAFLLISPSAQRVFRTRFFKFLGQVSFSIYLLHVPLLCSLGCSVFLFALRQGWSQGLAGGLATLATSATTLALAVPFRKYIDKAAIDWSKRWSEQVVSLQPGGGAP